MERNRKMLTAVFRIPPGTAASSSKWLLALLLCLPVIGLLACGTEQSAPPELISSGSDFTCMLQADGSLACWGSDAFVQTPALEGESFTTISMSGHHICALRQDGSPICWGYDDSGQTSPPEGEKFIAISSGGLHTCALRQDVYPVCWGMNGHPRLFLPGIHLGQATPPEGERFTAISSGYSHTCGLRADNSPVCWGAFGGISGHTHSCKQDNDTLTCWFSDGVGPPLSCGLRTGDSPPGLEDSANP